MRIFRTKKREGGPDYFFISCLIVIVVFGLLMLSSASSDLGKIKFNDTYYYLKHQLLYGLTLGLAGFLAGYFINYRFWQRWAFFLLILSIIFLILVFTPLGFKHAGANRWLSIGSFTFQPAELLKFTFIIYLAAWLSPKSGVLLRQRSFLGGYVPFIIISGIIAFLIILQPSTTTMVIILGAAVTLYFVSGAKISYILGTVFLAFLGLALIIYATPYRFERVTGFLNRYLDPQSVNVQSQGYHLNQALIAIGSGGVWGVGFGKSTTKFKYLPEPIGDSIFAVIAEELGFAGAAGLIILFMIFFLRGSVIARRAGDQFAKLAAIGFVSVMAIQTLIHIAAISGLIPLTGVPLPFISYGGTSLAVFLTMSGVIANISRYN